MIDKEIARLTEELSQAAYHPMMELVDEIAQFKHADWSKWALELMNEEELSKARMSRWTALIETDWDELSESMKTEDRLRAITEIEIVMKHMSQWLDEKKSVVEEAEA
jgi:hypothetical protein